MEVVEGGREGRGGGGGDEGRGGGRERSGRSGDRKPNSSWVVHSRSTYEIKEKRPAHVSKETYTYEIKEQPSVISFESDLHMCQKRPTHVSKETYTCLEEEDPFQLQRLSSSQARLQVSWPIVVRECASDRERSCI